MRRFLSVFLVLTLAVSMFYLGVGADSSNHANYNEIQPIVRVRVNGSWYGADLTPYKGQSNTWVEIPIEASKLKSSTTNYFSLSTNVSSDGNLTDGSADLYATAQEGTWGSFLCSDRWCDNGYTEYNDRNVNLKVQVYENGAWKTLAENASYAADKSTVLGQYQGGDWYNAGRNIDLGDVSGYTKARVLVNMHVGKDVASLTDFQMDQLATFYSYAAAMRIRVNGAWYGAGLEDYKGENDAWVYCPVPLSALKGNEVNYLSLTTNVKNSGNFSDSSVDLYATPTANASDSFLCSDQYCDNGYSAYTDRVVNVRLELYDGRHWTAAPADATYTTGEHCVLGNFTNDGNWYNAARNIALSNVDLTKYTGARVAVNLHVGSSLAVDGYVINQFATFVDAVKETPISYYTVTATAQTGGSVSGAPTEKVEDGTEVTVTATPETDYKFTGWYSKNKLVSDQTAYTFAVTADTALEARFTLKAKPTYTITAVAAEGGSVSGDGIVNEGSAVTLVAVANTGYDFVGWYEEDQTLASNEASYSFTAESNRTLTAKFAKKTYTVSATAQEGGQISGIPEEKVPHGTNVTLTATANDGYVFDGWYNGETRVSTNAAYTFAAAGDITLTAHFSVYDPATGHKTTPDAPAAAESTEDSNQAALRVRVNGSWYGAYINQYKGQNDVWVPVYVDIGKLKAGEENYFHFSTNVISHGNFTDSSVDLYATFTSENLSSFLTQHQYCDENFASYSDRNINIRLELFNGSEWVTVTPKENTYFDEHTVLGQFANDGNWYNAARNLTLGDLSGYTKARVLVNMHVGKNLDVAKDFSEENFGVFTGTIEWVIPFCILTMGTAGMTMFFTRKRKTKAAR